MAEIAAGAVVCRGAVLQGKVTVGKGCVIHPSVRIVAEEGPIIIGENNLIEEQATIINTTKGPPLVIGNNNVFEVGSHIESLQIGDGNIFEPKCFVGNETSIQNNTRIGTKVKLTSCEMVPSDTIVYSAQQRRRQQLGKAREAVYDEQLQLLRQMLPKFHPMQATK